MGRDVKIFQPLFCCFCLNATCIFFPSLFPLRLQDQVIFCLFPQWNLCTFLHKFLSLSTGFFPFCSFSNYAQHGICLFHRQQQQSTYLKEGKLATACMAESSIHMQHQSLHKVSQLVYRLQIVTLSMMQLCCLLCRTVILSQLLMYLCWDVELIWDGTKGFPDDD